MTGSNMETTFGYAFFLALILLFGLTTSEPALPDTLPAGPSRERIDAPGALSSYQQYLAVIGEHGGPSIRVSLEATVVSLLRSEVCPYQEENCRIPPYPSDWGTVRVDRVLWSQKDAAERKDEQAARGRQRERQRSTAPSPGSRDPERSAPPPTLRADQRVETQFLFTARLAIVRRVPHPLVDNSFEGSGQTAAEARPRLTFEPLPKEDGRYLFTVGVTDATEPEENALPGLDSGDRFRATAGYDGVLRVRTYEMLSPVPMNAPRSGDPL